MRRAMTLMVASALGFVVAPGAANADKTELGGHLGVGIPIVNTVPGKTLYTGQLSPRLLFGLTAKKSKNVMFDFEFVFVLPTDSVPGAFVIDPGFLYNWDGIITTGLRAALAIPGNGGRIDYGLIPILVKSFPLGGYSYFVELDFPIFFRDRADFTFQFVTGIAF